VSHVTSEMGHLVTIVRGSKALFSQSCHAANLSPENDDLLEQIVKLKHSGCVL
jgi:hypothetical protein